MKALGLPGIAFTREPRRFYPNRTLAATIMGHAGSEGNGLDGVELALDKAAARHGVVGAGDAGRAGARHRLEGTGDTVDGPATPPAATSC